VIDPVLDEVREREDEQVLVRPYREVFGDVDLDASLPLGLEVGCDRFEHVADGQRWGRMARRLDRPFEAAGLLARFDHAVDGVASRFEHVREFVVVGPICDDADVAPDGR